MVYYTLKLFAGYFCSAKSTSMREASHQPAFMSSCLNIIHTHLPRPPSGRTMEWSILEWSICCWEGGELRIGEWCVRVAGGNIHGQNWLTDTVRPAKWYFDTMEIIYFFPMRVHLKRYLVEFYHASIYFCEIGNWN